MKHRLHIHGSKTIQGNNNANTLNTTATKTTLHGLGGNDTLTGSHGQ
jgi:Ca2+-binding RTX toxin-like protein